MFQPRKHLPDGISMQTDAVGQVSEGVGGGGQCTVTQYDLSVTAIRGRKGSVQCSDRVATDGLPLRPRHFEAVLHLFA